MTDLPTTYQPPAPYAPYGKRTGRINAKPRNREHKLQVACVRWFRAQWPKYLLFSVPNGGRRDAITGAYLRDEGQTPGIPDLMLAVPSGGYHGAFFEMKTDTGSLSPVQRERIAYLQSHGYKCAVCRSVEAFIEEVNGYLNPEQ
jgi:hypothetical protein